MSLEVERREGKSLESSVNGKPAGRVDAFAVRAKVSLFYFLSHLCEGAECEFLHYNVLC